MFKIFAVPGHEKIPRPTVLQAASQQGAYTYFGKLFWGSWGNANQFAGLHKQLEAAKNVSR
jgi:hypothetical protein